MNPLLNFTQLPFFDAIKAEHALPALNSVLRECRSGIAQLSQIENPQWHNFALEMENLDERLNRVWSPISHLNGVNDSDELRQAYQQGIRLLTEYHSQLGQNQALYLQYKKIKQRSDFNSLSAAQQKVIENSLVDFRLSGADLNAADQARLREINLRLADLSNDFERNVLDSTQAWSMLITDQSKLSGMPESSLNMAKQMAQKANQDGWMLSLQIPSYLAVMQHVDNAEIRQSVYRAYTRRASELSDQAKFDNTACIDSILECRLEKARLLGFNNYAEYSLLKKMANTSAQVIHFLNDLAAHAKPMAKQELIQLKEFANKQYAVTKLHPWDISYYSERLREHQYAFNDEQIKPYFPAPQVFAGMFEIVQRLFDISITINHKIQTWHRDVRCYDVMDSKSNRLIGQFYADIYVRENKRSGAWMDTCIDRRRNNHTVQLPVAFLSCNFSPPLGTDPALLTHDEVETLFHEFGHCLHHLLTQVDEMSVAGINGVAWDAVELPSQFLENWCWHDQSLNLIAKHYQSGEQLPDELLEKMRAAKNFQSGLQTLRQVEFAIFDMLIHSEYSPSDSDTSVQSILDNVRETVAVLETTKDNRFQNSFGHIFAGGYGAGYYSYKWAEVLSADAFARFADDGIFNSATGDDFKKAILQRGGVEDMQELFIEFRGRPAKIEPLLRQSGIVK